MEKSEEPIKQEKAVTEEPAVVPLQETLKSETPAEPVPISGTVNAPVKVETLKSEIPAEPVPVSGTVNAPVKVDTEKVTGEVTPGSEGELRFQRSERQSLNPHRRRARGMHPVDRGRALRGRKYFGAAAPEPLAKAKDVRATRASLDRPGYLATCFP